jgi:hypothetical protein
MLNIDIADDARKKIVLPLYNMKVMANSNASTSISILPTCSITFFGMIAIFIDKN